MQAEGHTRLDGCRKPLKLKFQIQQELGVKPEFTKGRKGSNYAPELSEWLVSTLLSVGTRRSADGIFERTNGVLVGTSGRHGGLCVVPTTDERCHIVVERLQRRCVGVDHVSRFVKPKFDVLLQLCRNWQMLHFVYAFKKWRGQIEIARIYLHPQVRVVFHCRRQIDHNVDCLRQRYGHSRRLVQKIPGLPNVDLRLVLTVLPEFQLLTYVVVERRHVGRADRR